MIKIGPATISFGKSKKEYPVQDLEITFHPNCKSSIEDILQPKTVKMYFCMKDGQRLKKTTIITGYNPNTGEEIEEIEYVCPKCTRKLEFNLFGLPVSMSKISKKKGKKS